MKWIISVIAVLGLVACGVHCDPKPPKRAYFYPDGGHGMAYHIGVYRPYGELAHSGAGCTKYDYSSFQMYTDKNSGTIRGDEIIWKNYFDENAPIEEQGNILSYITVIITHDTVEIRGFKDTKENGIYKIEHTPPESWGVPLG